MDTPQIDPFSRWLLDKFKETCHLENSGGWPGIELALMDMGYYLYARPIGTTERWIAEVSKNRPSGEVVEEFDCELYMPWDDSTREERLTTIAVYKGD